MPTRPQNAARTGSRSTSWSNPTPGRPPPPRLTKANGPDNSDATIGAELLEGDSTLPAPAGPEDTHAPGGKPTGEALNSEGGGSEQVEVLGDSAYGTGEMLDALERTGRKATIKAVADPAGGRGRVHHRRLRLR